MIRNQDVPVTIVVSDTLVPLHFALPKGMNGNITWDTVNQTSLPDLFDMPELSNMNENLVDGLYDRKREKPFPFRPLQRKVLIIH